MDLVVNLFIGLTQEENPTPVEKPIRPTRLDPFAELREAAGPIIIDYTGRYQNSRSISFMDFSRGDRRWLNALLLDLQRIHVGSSKDINIMHSIASVRNGSQQKQTWQDFVDDLIRDKVNTGHDFTTGQLKHLPTLIDLLSKGGKLAGCGSLRFKESVTKKVLE